MLTLFAMPKPFRAHTAIIQRNAISSWTQLRPPCQILLFGNEHGTADVAKESGICHVPEVARNEYGTPLVNDLFDRAQRLAGNDLLCYVNSDIILLSDFVRAIRRIPFRRFLMVGQRWDVDFDRPWDFGQADWEGRLREYVRNHGTLQRRDAIDYFVFRSGVYGEIPPFAVGRIAWDNWMIYHARASGAAVIDATHAVMAVHQNHDYAHLQGGKTEAWEGTEAQRNLGLAGGYSHVFTLDDALWVLPASGIIKPQLSGERLKQQWSRLRVLPLSAWRLYLMRGLLAVVLAYQEKRLVRSIVRGARRMMTSWRTEN